MPVRGPEASHRTSFAIFISAPASVRSDDDTATSASCEASCTNRFSRLLERLPRLHRAGAAPRAARTRRARSARCRPRCHRWPGPSPVAGVPHVVLRVADLRRPRPDLLPERHRRRVLQVGAPDLDDVARARAALASRPRPARRRPGAAARPSSSTTATCTAVGKVSLLDWLLLTSSLGCTGDFEPELAAEDLDRAVGDDLVGVHVALRARPGLEDDEREVVVELAARHLVGGLHDRPGDLDVEQPEVGVRQRGHFFSSPSPRITARPQTKVSRPMSKCSRLRWVWRPPVPVGGHLDGAHRVAFGASRRHHPTVCRCARAGHFGSVGASRRRRACR